MNKKGNLLTSEVLKMVVAVICIGFLIYFITALYYSNITNKNTIKAQSLIDRIGSEIINLNQNNLENFSIYDLSPEGWSVFGFVSPERKPSFCSGKNCLCVCKKTNSLLGDNEERQLGRCDEDGACLIIENLKDFSEFEIGREEGVFSSLEIKRVENFLEVNSI